VSSPASPGARGLLKRYRKLSLGAKTLAFMVLGVIAGLLVGERARLVQPLGDLFIRLLMMVAIPLVFFNLLAGLTSLTDLRALGRIGRRIVAYYFLTTVLALAFGILAMRWLKPGVGMEGQATEPPPAVGDPPRAKDVLLEIVPDNVAAAFSEGRVTQVVAFAVFLGIASLLMPAPQKDTLAHFYRLGADLLRKLVEIVLRVSPVGIGALAAATVGQHGAALFGPLGLFIVGVWAAEAAMVVVYLTLLHFVARSSPRQFLRDTAPVYATTAATCSSLASLVVALEVAETRLKLPASIYGFTLPLGIQIDKDGTAAMLAALVVFTAQGSGVELNLAALGSILLVGLVLAPSSGGIPAGGLVTGFLFVKTFSLPLELAAMVGGIYRILDMGNTTLNCMGPLVGTALVARLEGAGEAAA
jgi:proton glutamate symport protein